MWHRGITVFHVGQLPSTFILTNQNHDQSVLLSEMQMIRYNSLFFYKRRYLKFTFLVSMRQEVAIQIFKSLLRHTVRFFFCHGHLSKSFQRSAARISVFQYFCCYSQYTKPCHYPMFIIKNSAGTIPHSYLVHN